MPLTAEASAEVGTYSIWLRQPKPIFWQDSALIAGRSLRRPCGAFIADCNSFPQLALWAGHLAPLPRLSIESLRKNGAFRRLVDEQKSW